MNKGVRSLYKSIKQQQKNYQIRTRTMKDKEGETRCQIDEVKTTTGTVFSRSVI